MALQQMNKNILEETYLERLIPQKMNSIQNLQVRKYHSPRGFSSSLTLTLTNSQFK